MERERQAQEAANKNKGPSPAPGTGPSGSSAHIQRPPSTSSQSSPQPQMHGNRLTVDSKGPGSASTSPTIPTSKPPGSASETPTPGSTASGGGGPERPPSRVVPTIPAGNTGLRPSYTPLSVFGGGAPRDPTQPTRSESFPLRRTSRTLCTDRWQPILCMVDHTALEV